MSFQFQTTGRPGEERSFTAAVKQSRGKWELQFPSALAHPTVLCESVEGEPSDRVCQSTSTSASFKCDVLKRFGKR